MSQPRLSLEEVRAIVADVSFRDREFRVLEKGDGFLVQLSYREEDVEHPERGPVLQSGRKWYVSAFSTTSEVVETCFAAVLRSQHHVAGEHFLYRGRRIYSPHFDVEARVAMVDAGDFDKREAP